MGRRNLVTLGKSLFALPHILLLQTGMVVFHKCILGIESLM